MNNLNRHNRLRRTTVVPALLALGLAVGFSGVAYSQTVIRSGEKQVKQDDNSQDGLFDYETTQDQDKELQAHSALKAGDRAPDIMLTPLADSALGAPVQLSSLYSKKPAVVFMGSCTCGLTKENVPKIEELYKKTQGQVNFAFVYIKDAHPAPGKTVDIGGENVRLAQSRTMSHRIKLTKRLLQRTGLTLPIYIDDMKGSGRKAFAGYHLSAYVIDTDGKLAFVRRYKYDVADVETALTALLERGEKPQLKPVAIQSGVVSLAPKNTRIGFVGTHEGAKPDPREGGFAKFSGTAEVADSGILRSVAFEIQTKSLWTRIDKLTAHLKSPDFFDVREHPTAKFRSTSVRPAEKAGTFDLTGEFTLHGVTRKIKAPATVSVTKKGLILKCEFTLDRTQFGMDYGIGKVKKNVTVTVVIGEPTGSGSSGKSAQAR